MTENTADKYPGWRFLYSPRWLGYYVMLAVFAVGCVLLSHWQFDRLDEKKIEINALKTNYDIAPVPLADFFPPHTAYNLEKHRWRQISMTGHYTGDAILVRNRPGPNRSGSEILQEFIADNGQIIFVDRGWIDIQVGDAGADLSKANEYAAPQNVPMQVTARLISNEPELVGSHASGRTVGSININQLAEVAQATGNPQLTREVHAQLIADKPLSGAEPQHGTLPPKPDLDEGPHLSYALQWLVFILVAGTGIGYAARQEFKHFNRGSRKVERLEKKAAARAARRQERRGLSDAEEEDALLDG